MKNEIKAKEINYYVPPSEPIEVVNQRVAKQEKRILIERGLGIPVAFFDGSSKEEGLFKSSKEELGYHRDCLLLGSLVDKDEPIPPDLILRILNIKRRREQLEKKKK